MARDGRDTAMRTAALVMTALFAATNVPAAAAQSQPDAMSVPLVRLKPADPEMRRLIGDGFRRSQAFRDLVQAIHASNAIVIVQFGQCANGRFRSCVTNVDGNERQRNIRIKVNTRTTDDRLIATIAHELQHALEILSERSAIDATSVLALYRRIGNGECRRGLSDACETDAAQAVEATVMNELDVASRQR
jgi:hypothetical protein